MSEPRTAHPFHIYEAIHAQPAIARRMLAERADLVASAARAAANKKRLWIAGIGSSLYTAQIAENFLRHLTGGRADVRAEQSFEFVRYPHALGPDDAVIVLSHTGGTTYSIEALQLARRSGALTITISGENENAAMRSSDFLINTCEQELSFAYTKSFTAALARLALFSLHFAEFRGENVSAAKQALLQIPDLMQRSEEHTSELQS